MSSPAVSGGPLQSKPTWSDALKWRSATSAFFVFHRARLHISPPGESQVSRFESLGCRTFCSRLTRDQYFTQKAQAMRPNQFLTGPLRSRLPKSWQIAASGRRATLTCRLRTAT